MQARGVGERLLREAQSLPPLSQPPPEALQKVILSFRGLGSTHCISLPRRLSPAARLRQARVESPVVCASPRGEWTLPPAQVCASAAMVAAGATPSTVEYLPQGWAG
jgi:hypothetical protein